jgi:hypothetical protein
MSRFLRGLLCPGEHQISPVALKKQKGQIRVCSPLSPGGQKSFLYPQWSQTLRGTGKFSGKRKQYVYMLLSGIMNYTG